MTANDVWKSNLFSDDKRSYTGMHTLCLDKPIRRHNSTEVHTSNHKIANAMPNRHTTVENITGPLRVNRSDRMTIEVYHIIPVSDLIRRLRTC